jgi:hypothetical protein
MLVHFADCYDRLSLLNVKATLWASLRFGLDILCCKPIIAFMAKWIMNIFLLWVLEKLSSEC